ncbi:MAG: fumarylacetoacetate hydrolase family protein [Desulfobacterales bacterium]
MRLIRFGSRGEERTGIWRDGRVVDLQSHFPEIPEPGERFFREGWLEKAKTVTDKGFPYAGRLGAPIPRPTKIVCLGKNYAEHAREGSFEPPERPLLFCKSMNAVNGPEDPILLPKSSGRIDWEVELAVVIGREAKRIPKSRAVEYVAGYMVMNDVSGREAQFRDSQWYRGKSFDTFAPMGPALVTVDEIPDPGRLRLWAKVNGELMQDGTTADLIFDIPTLIADISEDITLVPGDIISTGTPAGVGIFRDPPVVLRTGDVVECGIDGIGILRNEVVDG